MARRRVLFVGLQRMTSELLAGLMHDAGEYEVVATVSDRASLLGAVRVHRPDLVMIALQDPDLAPDWERLFVEFPALQVMAVTPNGRRTCLFGELVGKDPLATHRSKREPDTAEGT